MKNADEEMKNAVAAYTGPVTRYHPGKARGKLVKPIDAAAKWISGHGGNQPAEDPRAAAKRERRERQRIERHNAWRA